MAHAVCFDFRIAAIAFSLVGSMIAPAMAEAPPLIGADSTVGAVYKVATPNPGGARLGQKDLLADAQRHLEEKNLTLAVAVLSVASSK